MYNIDPPLIDTYKIRASDQNMVRLYAIVSDRTYICSYIVTVPSVVAGPAETGNNLIRSVFAHGALLPPPTAANFIRR